MAQRLLQGGDHGLAVEAILGGLIFVEADHVTPLACHPDLFHLQRRRIIRVVALRMNLGVASAARHHRFGFRRTSHPHAEDILPLSFLHFGQRLGADHAPVGHDAHRADPEPRLEPLHDRNQALHVRGVAGPQFATDGMAVLIQHHTHHHLLPVGTMIFGVPAPADGLAACSVKVDGSGAEENQIQAREQVLASREQRFLQQIFIRAWREGRGVSLLVFRQRFAQPSHGPVKMVQTQFADPRDGIVVFPFLGGAIATGGKQAMQHGEENRALDRKLEAAVFQQGKQNLVDRASFPEPLKNQGRADPGATSGATFTACVCAQNRKLLRKSPQRLDQRVETTASQKLIQAAEAKQDTLFDFAVNPFVVHDE